MHGIGVTWHACSELGCEFKAKEEGTLDRHGANVHDINVLLVVLRLRELRSQGQAELSHHKPQGQQPQRRRRLEAVPHRLEDEDHFTTYLHPDRLAHDPTALHFYSAVRKMQEEVAGAPDGTPNVGHLSSLGTSPGDSDSERSHCGQVSARADTTAGRRGLQASRGRGRVAVTKTGAPRQACRRPAL